MLSSHSLTSHNVIFKIYGVRFNAETVFAGKHHQETAPGKQQRIAQICIYSQFNLRFELRSSSSVITGAGTSCTVSVKAKLKNY